MPGLVGFCRWEGNCKSLDWIFRFSEQGHESPCLAGNLLLGGLQGDTDHLLPLSGHLEDMGPAGVTCTGGEAHLWLT